MPAPHTQEKEWTTAYAAAGDTVSLPSSRYGADVVVGDPEVHDLILVHDTFEIFAVDAEGCQALDADEERLDLLMGILVRAQRAAAQRPPLAPGAIDPDVAAAKEAVAAEIGPIVGSPGGVTLTEIRRVSGAKWTYVRSDKIRNHWRSYSLDVQDRDGSIRNEEGKITRDRVIDKAAKAEAALKLDAKWTFEEGVIPSMMGDWFDEIHDSLNGDLVGEGETRMLDRSAEAQFLRYYAGASVAGEFDLRDGKFGAKGELKGSFALAEGKVGLNGYLPHASGWRLRPSVPVAGGGRQTVDLGAVRLHGELMLQGFVGASVAGSVKVEVSMDQGRALVRAARPSGSASGDDLDTDGQVASATARAFVGVEGSVELKGGLEWDNPDGQTGGQSNWKAFLTLGGELGGALGAGAEAEFTVSYEAGRFMVRARAGLVWGAGGKGKVSFEVDVGLVAEFVAFLYHRLRDARYRYLTWITEDAFRALTRLVAGAVATGVDLAGAAAQGLADVGLAVWADAVGRAETQALARHIRRAGAVRYATPEAKGALLHQLLASKEFWVYAEEPEEEAALTVLEWVQSQREFEEVCEHLAAGGQRTTYAQGRRRLNAFFDGADLRAYRLRLAQLREMEVGQLSSRVLRAGDPLLNAYPATRAADTALVRTRLA